jgi:isochorismate synthase
LNITTQNIVNNKTLPSFDQLWDFALNEKYAVAVWRLPRQNSLHFMADFSGKPSQHKIDFETELSGFCISPFLNNSGKDTSILNNDIYFELNEELKIKNNDLALPNLLFLEKVSDFKKSESKKAPDAHPETKFDNSNKVTFKKMVGNSIKKIDQGFFQKVVLSRQKAIEFDYLINIGESVKKLSAMYPNAFISAVYLPVQNEIWMGASPELLVSLDKDGIFKTMSLAGTQAAHDSNGNKIDPTNARWSQKEIEEQAYVSRYIINCLKKVRVREYIENGPKTVAAGNLLHLQTSFSVDTKAIDFDQFATVMLELLHPTSAVCGMPMDSAKKFILENENYNREFYSGYLGPLNVNGSSNIFVNLRSLKMKGNTAYFYAGAGITEHSDPEKEWLETEMKMETLLKVLND